MVRRESSDLGRETGRVEGIRSWRPELATVLLQLEATPERAEDLLDRTLGALLRSNAPRGRSAAETLRVIGDWLARGGDFEVGSETRDGPLAAPPEEYEPALSDFEERYGELHSRLRREELTVEDLTAELRRQPSIRQRWMVRNVQRFHSYRLAEHLLALTWKLWHEEPEEAERLAGLALDVCEELDEGVYGERMIHDLRGRSLALLANSRRILLRLRNVEEFFNAAEFHLQKGTGDPDLMARVLQLKASLRVRQSRFDEADALLQQASKIFEEEGNLADWARAFFSRAIFKRQHGEIDAALAMLEEVAQLTRELEPRLYYYCHHNVTSILVEVGHDEEALGRIATSRDLAKKFGGTIDLLKVDWLEGNILANLGRVDEARKLLRRAMEALFEHRMELDGIGAGLDLTALHLRQGQTEEARGLVPEILGRAREVHQNIFAALVTLQQALREDRASPELTKEVSDFLDVAEVNPTARFEPSTAT